MQYRLVKGAYNEKCKDCETVQCSACKENINVALFKPKQVSNYYQDRGVLCAKCNAHGHTVYDMQNYKCTDCKGSFRRVKFDAKQLHNFTTSQRTLLVCEERRAREARIRKALRLPSSWKKLHGGYTERRWLGKINHISEDDWKFWNLRKKP